MSEKNETLFACDMTTISTDQRGGHLATIESLFRSVSQVEQLTNGYSFRLPNNAESLRKAAEFIALEKLCCPFFGFTLEVEKEGGAVWLSLTGSEGVKPFILAEIGNFLTPITGS